MVNYRLDKHNSNLLSVWWELVEFKLSDTLLIQELSIQSCFANYLLGSSQNSFCNETLYFIAMKHAVSSICMVFPHVEYQVWSNITKIDSFDRYVMWHWKYTNLTLFPLLILPLITNIISVNLRNVDFQLNMFHRFRLSCFFPHRQH